MTLKYATKLISVSKTAGSIAFGDNKFTVIANPVDSMFAKNPTIPKDNLILQVGSFSTLKNQLFSLEVFSLLEKNNKNLKLAFVGFENERNYISKLKCRINELNLNEKIIFLDEEIFLPTIYNKSKLTLFPSLSEGFGLVALESQACGTPVICSNFVPPDVDAGLAIFIKLDVLEWYKKAKVLINEDNQANKKVKIKRIKQFANEIKKCYL